MNTSKYKHLISLLLLAQLAACQNPGAVSPNLPAKGSAAAEAPQNALDGSQPAGPHKATANPAAQPEPGLSKPPLTSGQIAPVGLPISNAGQPANPVNAYLHRALARIQASTTVNAQDGGQIQVPALAAALVMDGRLVAEAAVGVRQVEDRTPIEVNDAFHIGSIAKPVTGFVAARLIERKLLSWNTTLYEVFPELWDDPAYGAQRGYRDLSVAQLMSHETGMPYAPGGGWSSHEGRNPDPTNTRRRRYEYLLAAVKDTQAITPVYGGGSIIVAAMLERLSQKSWETLLQEEVLDPLQLSYSGLGLPQAKQPAYAAEHRLIGTASYPSAPVDQKGDAAKGSLDAGLNAAALNDEALNAAAERFDPNQQPELPPDALQLPGPGLPNPELLWQIQPRVSPADYRFEPHGPAGRNLFMSVGDLARFCAANLPDSSPLSRENLDMMQTRYGARGFANGGWGAGSAPVGMVAPELAHDGTNGSNYSRAIVSRSEKAAYVAATNVADGDYGDTKVRLGSRALNQVIPELKAMRRHLAGLEAGGRPTAGLSVSASDSWPNNPACSSSGSCAAQNLIDDTLTTRWAATSTTPTIELALPAPANLRGLVLCEAIADRVQGFELQAEIDGSWRTLSRGTTIGAGRRVDFEPVSTGRLRLRISAASAAPTLSEIYLLHS